MTTEFKYFAFISYNSRDLKWGKRLQRKLEHYKMPSTLCSEHGWERKPLRPVFFAPTDIQIGDLNEELKERLRNSRHLIVICSPNSANSEWVGREIRYFHSLGRSKDIHFFIVAGTPNSRDPREECFNPVIKELGLSEVLGANINEKNYRWSHLNHERAYIQLITTLLGVEFDAIWQRHKRLMIERSIVATVIVLAIVVSLAWAWQAHRPVDVRVRLNETTLHNDNLPPLANATLTLTLDNDTISKEVAAGSTEVLFPNIPRNKLGGTVRLALHGDYYYPAEASTTLAETMTLDITRDTLLYGMVRFNLRDSEYQRVVGEDITIAGTTATSDAEGRVELYIPIEHQREWQQIECRRPLKRDSIKLPCTGDELISLK